MNERIIEYICPLCHTEIQAKGEDVYRCTNCSINFPIVQEIPDFRLPSERDISKSDNRQRPVDSILKNYKSMTFEELLKLRFSSARLPSDVYNLHIKHELNAIERGWERLLNIKSLLHSQNRALIKSNFCLDLGCGMGSALFSMSSIFGKAVGVDISFVDLLLAKKRFQEHGIKNVTLICASVENLPFKSGFFNLINATDVIEHISDQEKFLLEANRVLKGGGYFYFNSPNRFNIFSPEPHVNLWWVGFLPRRYMSRYVRFIKGMDYSGKRLLSYFELTRIIEKVFEKNYIMEGIIMNNNLDTRKSLKIHIAKKFPILLKLINSLFKVFIPGYEVLVFK